MLEGNLPRMEIRLDYVIDLGPDSVMFRRQELRDPT